MSAAVLELARKFRGLRLLKPNVVRSIAFGFRGTSVGGSPSPSVFRFYCSAAADCEEDVTREKEDKKGPQRETINQRLKRLSMSDPDKFAATVTPEQAEEQRYYKYTEAPFPDQRSRSSRPLRGPFRPSRSTWGLGPSYGDDSEDSYDRPQRNQNWDRDRSGYGGNARGNFRGQGDDDYFDNRNRMPQRSYRRITADEDDIEDYSYGERSYRSNRSAMRTRPSSVDGYDDGDSHDLRRFRQTGSQNTRNYDYLEDPSNRRQKLAEYDLDEDSEYGGSTYDRNSNKQNIEALKRTLGKMQPIDPIGSKREIHADVGLKRFGKEQFALPNKKAELTDGTKNFQPGKSDDADVFGTVFLRQRKPRDQITEDDFRNEITESYVDPMFEEEELQEEEENFIPERKMTMNRLVKETLNLVEANKLAEALDFFTESLVKGGFQFDKSELRYIYRVLISACGQAGYVKMAFKLYTRCRKMGITVRQSTFTSLFNACGNSPWYAEENIERIDKLREAMKSQGYVPNVLNYNAMIKAYGRNFALDAAYAVVDEMIETNVRPRFDTFAFLLQACISDKKNGFRHAILTWDKMKERKIRLSPESYNLLLRCARECGVEFPPFIEKQLEKYKKRIALSASTNTTQTSSSSKGLTTSPGTASSLVLQDNPYARLRTSLAATEPNSQLYSAQSLQKMSDAELETLAGFSEPGARLKILGGTAGLLVQMRKDKVRPNLKTLQEMILCACTLEDIDNAVRAVDFLDLEPDTIFFNVVIKKLMEMHHHEGAMEVFDSMKEKKIKPDIYTWGALAWGCTSWPKVQQLFTILEAHSVSPNVEIMGTLIQKACLRCDPACVVELLLSFPRFRILSNDIIINSLEKFKNQLQVNIVKYEKGEALPWPLVKRNIEKDPHFLEQVSAFKKFYRGWKENAYINLPSADPWEKHFESVRRKKQEGSYMKPQNV